MSAGLTQDEARERASLVTVASYDVDLDLTRGDTAFGSTSVIRFGCAAPGAGTFVDLTAPVVRRVTLNGAEVDLAAFDGNRVALTGLAADNVLVVEAECAYSRTGDGLHRFTDPADGLTYTYTDLETFDAHRVYACFDQPDLKAAFTFAVSAPADWAVVSNMPVESSTGLRRRFSTSPPLPTYVTAIIAGPYHEVRGEHDAIPLGVYCRLSLAAHLDADEILTVTRQGFDFFHAAFGVRYPFPKYDQLFVPEFKGGAMENAGAVTFSEECLFRSRVTDFARQARAETILHELAHMWFGDLVTMRWWDDLWLNESFASWAATLALSEATRWNSGWTAFAQLSKAWAYRQDQMATTHPIAADIQDIAAVEVNFDGITYAKGASVLKQLVSWNGRENFLSGVRDYFAAHAWGNATLADLLAALERRSGRDLTAWSDQWLRTAGVNTLRPSIEVDPSGRITSFDVLQEAPAAHPALRDHRIAIGFYDQEPEGFIRTRSFEVDVSGARTELPELAGQVRPDLVLLNDDDLTYAKIRLDGHSLRTLAASVGDLGDSLAAALCWATAWDMCRDGELAARDYVRLVTSGVGSLSAVSMVEALLAQAAVAIRRYADPPWRESGLDLLAGATRRLAGEATAGSDTQLAFVRACARAATSDEDLKFLAGLLDGSVRLDGLTVDTELRWSLLGRLVGRGVLGAEEIDAELKRDPTDAGRRHALTCRASMPTGAAKEAAWWELTLGEVPLAEFRAVLAGFADPDQQDLTVAYRDRYFAAIGDVWRDLPTVMAQDFVSGLYVSCPFTEDTIQATDAYLAADHPPDALRRLLTEGRDDVVRALRSQARDRQEATP
ncbi:aminopeptidase N [Streptosporangiaceae bacterium NEAU-GS5]|nr:aminopeptidase N [Streptosporangiaceae bacterium NEAU-GS5]